jgi:hypothetical protein
MKRQALRIALYMMSIKNYSHMENISTRTATPYTKGACGIWPCATGYVFFGTRFFGTRFSEHIFVDFLPAPFSSSPGSRWHQGRDSFRRN